MRIKMDYGDNLRMQIFLLNVIARSHGGTTKQSLRLEQCPKGLLRRMILPSVESCSSQ